MLTVKIREVKQEYQLQQWSGMLRERKESGVSVKAWCQEQGLAHLLLPAPEVAVGSLHCIGTGTAGTVSDYDLV